MKLLNLGCGGVYHKDWINIDFVSRNENVKSHNLLKGIPLDSNSMDVVYHSHVLEHFSKFDGKQFIKECHRVLKKGGIIRIAVPDYERIVKEYISNLELALENNKKGVENYEWITLELFDQMVRNNSGGLMKSYLGKKDLTNEEYVYERFGSEAVNLRNTLLNSPLEPKNEAKIKISKNSFIDKVKRKLVSYLIDNNQIVLSKNDPTLTIGRFRMSGEIHQWMYDRYSLGKLLNEVGFIDIKVLDGFKSQVKKWDTYHLDIVDGRVRKPDSLFIEAIKK